jgi:Co/Zn/Cd efflux system component
MLAAMNDAGGTGHDQLGHAHGPGDHGHDHGPRSGDRRGHAHDHGDAHDHQHGSGLLDWVRHLIHPHSHEAADKVDAALEASAEGIRALWISLGILGGTAVIQAIVVVFSGSVALLGDTLHNLADALTALPLGVAFVVGRRPANRRHNYGYGRAEDLAGIAIIVQAGADR